MFVLMVKRGGHRQQIESLSPFWPHLQTCTSFSCVYQLSLKLWRLVHSQYRVHMWHHYAWPKVIHTKIYIRYTSLVTNQLQWNPAFRTHLNMRPFMIMQTLWLVWNAISIDLHTIRTPEMWPPHFLVKWTLGMAPTVSPLVQTHPHSGHLVK